MDIKKILEELCGCTAPSGFEGPAAQTASRLLEPLVDEVSIDRMGNVIGVRRCGRPGAKKLLLDDAHTVSEVASLVGMDNFSYFSTLFKKNTGLSPREYKQKTKQSI